jgi:hypothetical protein
MNIEIKKEKLFKAKLYGRDVTMSESRLEYHQKRSKNYLSDVSELDRKIPDVEIILQETRNGRCYTFSKYIVKSKIALSEDDFDTLRALECFMSGQKTGEIVSKVEDSGILIYTLVSECDSSD